MFKNILALFILIISLNPVHSAIEDFDPQKHGKDTGECVIAAYQHYSAALLRDAGLPQKDIIIKASRFKTPGQSTEDAFARATRAVEFVFKKSNEPPKVLSSKIYSACVELKQLPFNLKRTSWCWYLYALLEEIIILKKSGKTVEEAIAYVKQANPQLSEERIEKYVPQIYAMQGDIVKDNYIGLIRCSAQEEQDVQGIQDSYEDDEDE